MSGVPIRARAAVGDEALATLLRHRDALADTSTAFCTRPEWLIAAAECLPQTPVVITVARGERLVGLAPLAMSRDRLVLRVNALGHDQNDYTQALTVDEGAAYLLARAVARWLRRAGRWHLRLEQLAPEDPFLLSLARQLPGAVILPGAPMPRLRLGQDRSLATVLSHNERAKRNKSRNRLQRDGHRWELLTLTRPEHARPWLPRLAELRRNRDHDLGRRSHLDDPRVASFWRRVIDDALMQGRASVRVLVVDDEPGAYNVTFHDFGVHRLWDKRVVTAHARYSPGRVCDIAAIEAALSDPTTHTFDWLRGSDPSKVHTDVTRRVVLDATWHPIQRKLDDGIAAVRGRLKEGLPESARAWLVRH